MILLWFRYSDCGGNIEMRSGLVSLIVVAVVIGGFVVLSTS